MAATRTNQTFLSYTSPAGTTSQYHVYAEGVDFSKPVGVVFYFDGDYWQRDESKVYTPDEGMLAAMGKIANARNMVFVPIISPDTNASGNGITWWEDMDANGEFFRSFAKSFVSQNNLDYSKPVGVVFYFDGDYWQRDESKVCLLYTSDAADDLLTV